MRSKVNFNIGFRKGFFIKRYVFTGPRTPRGLGSESLVPLRSGTPGPRYPLGMVPLGSGGWGPRA